MPSSYYIMTTNRPLNPLHFIGYPKVLKITTFTILTEFTVNLRTFYLVNYQKKKLHKFHISEIYKVQNFIENE